MTASSRTAFYVYEIRCTVNDKVYVGKTADPEFRWYKHRWCAARNDGSRTCEAALYRAIRKYGADAFVMRVLASYDDEASAFIGERVWIARFRSFGPRGYNMSAGGEGQTGFKHTEASKLKMARHGPDNGCYGRVWTDAERERHAELTRRQFAEKGHPFLGREHSPEARAKMAIAAQGNQRCLGRVVGDETRQKMSAALNGKRAWNKGLVGAQVVSDETRAKMSLAHKQAWQNAERRATASEAMRRRAAAMTPEQREASMAPARIAQREAVKAAWAAMTPDERRARTQAMRDARRRKREAGS